MLSNRENSEFYRMRNVIVKSTHSEHALSNSHPSSADFTPTTQNSTYIDQVHVSYVVAVVIFHYVSSDGKRTRFGRRLTGTGAFDGTEEKRLRSAGL